MSLNRKIGNGFVLGKFMPLHAGHVYMLHFAQMSCHKLTIMVCSQKSDPIPGNVRFLWVKTQFPTANVVHMDHDIQQEPKGPDDQAFWDMWIDMIRYHCPGEKFDAVFGSEDYGWRLSQELNCEYIPVNRIRSMVPTSGTVVRHDPMKHWEYLPVVTRPYFVKRICILGPMSAGKSTLTASLAKHYNTVAVEEYARTYSNDLIHAGRRKLLEFLPEDLVNYARGQMISEDSAAFNANRVMFIDTDVLTTFCYCNILYGRHEAWLKKEMEERKYTHTFVLDPRGLKFYQDGERLNTNLQERVDFMNMLCSWLETVGRPFTILNAPNYEIRQEMIIRYVDRLLDNESVDLAEEAEYATHTEDMAVA